MNIKKTVAAFIATAMTTASFNPATVSAITASAFLANFTLAAQPAAAAWWDSVDGVFFMVGSEPYYFGSYSNNPNVEFSGSTWSVRCGGQVCAHGYSRTVPRWVTWLSNRLGR